MLLTLRRIPSRGGTTPYKFVVRCVSRVSRLDAPGFVQRDAGRYCTVQTCGRVGRMIGVHARNLSRLSQETLVHYPLYVQRRDGKGYRGTFADFPWLEMEGDTLDDLALDAARLVQRTYHRSERIIPAPTDDMSKLQALELDDGEGLWMFVDIDLADVQSHSVFIRLSLDKSLLQEIDLAARQHHMGRSAYIALACADELAHEGDDRALLRF